MVPALAEASGWQLLGDVLGFLLDALIGALRDTAARELLIAGIVLVFLGWLLGRRKRRESD